MNLKNLTEEQREIIENSYHDEEVFEAAMEVDIPVEDVEEAYQGRFFSDEEFAETLANDIGAITNDSSWPNYCIDWEWAARELMMDYVESNGCYFRVL